MKTFTIIVHREPTGGFWGEVPSLPGCYSQGETEEELLENLKEVIAGTLEVLREQGAAPDTDVRVVELAV